MNGALPIDPLLPDVVDALRRTPALVLRAAPGAGKTTRVPAALLDAGVAGGRNVVVLEPRRIAARAAAEFVARARGGGVGGEVGYRVRFEQRGGPATRLWFVTDGLFTRRLGRDPFLDDVGVVVLDEFHERHVDGDLALAVVRELQATVRPDLRLVVMSATLETDALARAMPGAAVLTSEGRAHPVTMQWRPGAAREPLAEQVAGAVRALVEAPDDDGGDVLVFLPGAGEIRRAAETLAPMARARAVDVLPLHGDLPLAQQEQALRRGPRRRIVLATNVAETALTVEGVTAVVDTGLARVSRFDVRHGLDRLVVAPISRASAEQRAGRAGRTAAGRCVRLWSREEHAGRRAHETAEILRLDLARLVLELRAWGLASPAMLSWLDPPPPASLARAERLLVALGALAAGDTATPTAVGRRMLGVPASPRVARMQLAAHDAGCAWTGALLAALASERDVLASARAFGGPAVDRPAGDSDLLLRLDLVVESARRGADAASCAALGLDARALRAVLRAQRQLARGAAGDTRAPDADTLLRCVLAGFPDRVARRRGAGSDRAVMVGGGGLVLDAASVVREAELFVAVDVEAGAGADARVRVASAVRREWLAELAPGALRRDEAVVFDETREAVVTRSCTSWLDLVLDERVAADVDRATAGVVLADAVVGDAARLARVASPHASLLDRLRFLAGAMPELGLAVDPTSLVAAAVRVLATGRRSLRELLDADVGASVRGLLDARQRRALAEDAPETWTLPGGRRVLIRYPADAAPVAAARIQDVFGVMETPRLAAGRVRLRLELLAPNGRPAQITDDLRSFWRTTYADVRKQLRGRYPKHAWPEDPTTATPRRGAR